jgi:hypothetical protein
MRGVAAREFHPRFVIVVVVVVVVFLLMRRVI